MSAPNRIPFSDAEKAVVRLHWSDPKVSVPAIARMLEGRSAKSVEYCGYKLLKLGKKGSHLLAWSDEQTAKLTALWNDPTHSIRDIGRTLGITKNSVIGKAYKLGLPDRKALAPGPRPTKPKRAKAPPRPKNWRTTPRDRSIAMNLANMAKQAKTPKTPEDLLYRAPPNEPLPNTTPMTLADMPGAGLNLCRWPVGADPGRGRMDEQLFCAAVTEDKHRYCAHHLARRDAKTRTPEQKAADFARAIKMKARFAGAAPKPNDDLFARARAA